MIYEEKIVSSLKKCKMCHLEFKETKILPCGHFCNNCIEFTRYTDTKEFKCESCNDIHLIPINGFKSWEEIFRSEIAENLKNNLKAFH